MQILLLGAHGQLARDLTRCLSHHNVIGRSHEELDIRDELMVSRAIREAHPDVIINTAAYHRVDDCEDHSDLALGVNAIGAYNLARAAQLNRSVLVHFSTDYVFDGAKASPYTEADRPNPLSVYGMSKWTGERLIAAYCEKHFIIRTCGLYGSGGSVSKGGNFVLSVLRAMQNGRPLRVVSDQIVTPTNTMDLAGKVAELAEQKAYGTYHMTNTGECSWYEFAREILHLLKIPTEITPVSTEEFAPKARRPAYSVLDNTRMRALGMAECRPWQEALAEFMMSEQKGLESAA